MGRWAMYRRRGGGSLPQTGLSVSSVSLDPLDLTVATFTFDRAFSASSTDPGDWFGLDIAGLDINAVISIDALDGQVSLQFVSPGIPGVTQWNVTGQPAAIAEDVRVPQSGTVL